MLESVNSNQQKVCSMSCNITVLVSDDFAKEAKRLAKKYPSFKQDYKDFLLSIKNNPLQGDEITKNIRKIRMAIKAKGKGKSGGARVCWRWRWRACSSLSLRPARGWPP